jgi:hypothetical protein
MSTSTRAEAEATRLAEDARREANWKRWGPYLAERQWATVREDYSAGGECWDYFPHDHARSRAYRWGEDGLLGMCDRQGRLCFGLALWNEKDPILKERLFGLTGPEGNHGEDVKECYYYLDSTPTHSSMKALYKYPQAEYPYARLVHENARRGRDQPELELADTGVFDDGRYFDVTAEYAKASPDDVLIRIMAANRGPEAAPLWVLPTLWFRNTWSWGRTGEGYWPRPVARADGAGVIRCEHATLGRFALHVDAGPDGPPELAFTENESNAERLWGAGNRTPYVKDAFHELVVRGRREAVNPAREGTKAAAVHRLLIPAGGEVTLRLRLVAETGVATAAPFGPAFDAVFAARRAEADAFYAARIPAEATPKERQVARQAYAGLLWSKQFYNYVVRDWLEGDPGAPTPPQGRRRGRNADWPFLQNRDVILMPDKWEYPWYAAWDLAFHVASVARIDGELAKEQLLLLTREWYMHPNGQIPAYEFALGDVNPPVHAWAAWTIYQTTGPRGGRDRAFLKRMFHKLLLNFTWWINRKDDEGNNLFGGGFLGLDNIAVFDRSHALPTGGSLEQADGTAWMGFFCATMLSISLELAAEEPKVYEDLAVKFLEHFVAIIDAMNSSGEDGLWDEEDGFYYDELHVNGHVTPLRVRSMVGVIPLYAVDVLEESTIAKLPALQRRLRWFEDNHPTFEHHVSVCGAGEQRLISIASRERLTRILRHVLDEEELLSPHGVRALSRFHRDHPFVYRCGDQEHRVDYMPGESTNGMFGGNSNWRGPVWMPVNHLLCEALERYHQFFGDDLKVECPTGSGRMLNLDEVGGLLSQRLTELFLPGPGGRRPCHGGESRYADDPHWRDLVLFYEYFHGDTGKGLGASHQTGWTALIVRAIEDVARHRRPPARRPRPVEPARSSPVG